MAATRKRTAMSQSRIAVLFKSFYKIIHTKFFIPFHPSIKPYIQSFSYSSISHTYKVVIPFYSSKVIHTKFFIPFYQSYIQNHTYILRCFLFCRNQKSARILTIFRSPDFPFFSQAPDTVKIPPVTHGNLTMSQNITNQPRFLLRLCSHPL